MIKISLQQLSSRLNETGKAKKFSPYYLLVGSELYLQYEAQKQLQTYLLAEGFEQQLIFTIDNQTDWNSIYDNCQSLSLFSSKTLLILQFGENGISAPITQKLNELVSMLNEDIALIIAITKLTKAQENSEWMKALSDNALWIYCQPPDTQHLPVWLNQQAKQKGITLDKSAAELLCYYYEGNLLALAQILEQLKLLYPDSTVTLNQIEHNINDSAIFSPYHWLDAILDGKTKRTVHILQQLKANDIEPLILLRTIQKELILLIQLKKQMVVMPLKQAFDQYKVWQNRRPFFTQTLNRLTLTQLFDALHQLAQIEISLKQDYSTSVWRELETLSLLLLGKVESRHL